MNLVLGPLKKNNNNHIQINTTWCWGFSDMYPISLILHGPSDKQWRGGHEP